MGKSKRPPSFGKSAGERFTVIRPAGNSKPEVSRAERTRSLLSRTTASGRPTIAKAGKPGPRCTSTRTNGAARPSGARLSTVLTAESLRIAQEYLQELAARADYPARARTNGYPYGGVSFASMSLSRCFHRRERGLGPRQHGRLHVEFGPAHQIELGQLRLQHRLEVALQISAQIAQRTAGTASARRRARSSNRSEFMKLIRPPSTGYRTR